jgi:hypothetical protein
MVKLGALLLVMVAPGILLAQPPKSAPAKFFTVDRSSLPPALQNVPLEHLSSGALMLLDRNGNLVKSPSVSPARRTAATTAAAQTEVALDPRIGSNLRLGDDPSALPANMRAQAEPHIARSPVNPDFLVATFQEGRFTDGGAVDCGYSISSDGGLSWTRALIPNLTQVVGGSYFRATDPVAGVDLSGNVYLNTEGATDVNFNNGDILVSKSTNGGANFAGPSVVYHPPNGNVFPDKPWMAINTFAGTATAGRILATFTLFSSGSFGGAIERAYSDNGGLSWSAVSIVSANVTNAQGSQPVFLPNGNAVVIYWNFGSPESLRLVKSTDGGATFAAPIVITNAVEYNEPSIRTGSILPSAVCDRTSGNLYVVYQTLLSGNPRIAFAKSTNGGANWSTPVAISDNPAGSGVFNPAINTSPDGQTLSVVFYDHRANPGSNTLVDLYLAQSFDGGMTWLPSIRLTSTSTDASLAPLTSSGYMLGDYQGVAESTNANVPAVPVWIDTRTGNPDPFIGRIGMAPQLTFTSWQAARLSLDEINNLQLGGANGNADADQKKNLLEYVLGTPPRVADTTSLSIEQIGSQFSVTYPRLKAATDASLHAFRSTDLTSWTNSGVTETLLSDDGTFQIWRASTPASFPTMFFRLQATQP